MRVSKRVRLEYYGQPMRAAVSVIELSTAMHDSRASLATPI
jgi:hypothetical protein